MTPLVRGLGYVRLQTTDLGLWRTVMIDGLGFSESPRRDAELLRLRMDGREERIVVRSGDSEQTLAIGWEARDQFALNAVGRALEAHAVDVEVLTEDECHERRIDGGLRFTDPSGTPVEIFHGAVRDDALMRTKWGQSFVTDELGMGTVAIGAHDVDSLDSFYAGVLGFSPRGAVQVPGMRAEARPVRTRLLGVNARHHSMVLSPGGSHFGGLQKIRVEVDSLDAVGTANDELLALGVVPTTTLGRHSNDRTLSFYCRMPGGLLFEYATDCLTVDADSFVPEEFVRRSRWGHEWQAPTPHDNIAQFPGRKHL